MRNFIHQLLLLFSLISGISFSQECVPTFIPLNQIGVKNADIQKTSDGGYLIAGTTNNTSNKRDDVFLLKLDVNGNEQWKKTIGDTNYNSCKSLFSSKDGSYFLIIYNSITPSYRDSLSVEFYKLREDGSEIWSNKNLFNGSKGTIESLIEDSLGNIILVGSNGSKTYISKLNSAGNIINFSNGYVFEKYFRISDGSIEFFRFGEYYTSAYAINTARDGNYLVSCFNMLSVDTWGNVYGANLIMKIDSNLKVIWSTLISRDIQNAHIVNSVQDKNDSVLIAFYKITQGRFVSQGSFISENILLYDSSNIRENLELCGINAIQTLDEPSDKLLIIGREGIAKIDSAGRLLSRSYFTDTGNTSYLTEGQHVIIKDGLNKYSIIGFKNGDLFLIKYDYFGDDCLAKLCGIVYFDEDRNCVQGSKETGVINFFTSYPYKCGRIYSDSSGYYELDMAFGQNIIQTPLSSFWKEGCDGNTYDTITMIYPQDKKRVFNIGLFKKDTCFLVQKEINYSGFRPCSNWLFDYQLCTGGDTTIKNINLQLSSSKSILDITANYPFTISGNTLQFDFDSLKRPECIHLKLKDSVSCNFKFGDTICYVAHLQFKKPCDTIIQEYIDTICRILRNSADPNYIEGYILDQFRCYPEKQYEVPIKYTIHFQNIGNDTAFKVVIRDTIDRKKFKSHTIVKGFSSHPYTFRKEQDSILVFEFDNINLLDSLNHEELSKGFVSFEIVGVNGQLDKIKQFNQQASIYFDSNAPIHTNLDVIKSCEDISTKTFKPKNSEIPFILRPNPVNDQLILEIEDYPITKSGFFVYNSIGQLMTKEINLQKQNKINTSSFPSGIYFILLKLNGNWYKKMFIITHP